LLNESIKISKNKNFFTPLIFKTLRSTI